MHTHRSGRHEQGQNFLTDPAVVRTFVDAVRATDGPIIEIGPGAGGLTLPLAGLGRRLSAVEVDAALARRLRAQVPPQVSIECADFLRWRLPRHPHVVVGNVPFHLTTALLRRLLHAPHWTQAILLVQWEVARRRAGVGGATMMTAQAWPWFEFALLARVPRRAFQPMPGVDGGLLRVDRRSEPLLAPGERDRYRQFVHRTFTGSGRGVRGIVLAQAGRQRRAQLRARLDALDLPGNALPKDLTASQWVQVFHAVGRGG